MRKPTSSTQVAAFLFVDSRWHEPHDAVQCRAHGSTFEFLFKNRIFLDFFFFSFKLFENQTVRLSTVHCIWKFIVSQCKILDVINIPISEFCRYTSIIATVTIGRIPNRGCHGKKTGCVRYSPSRVNGSVELYWFSWQKRFCSKIVFCTFWRE